MFVKRFPVISEVVAPPLTQLCVLLVALGDTWGGCCPVSVVSPCPVATCRSGDGGGGTSLSYVIVDS